MTIARVRTSDEFLNQNHFRYGKTSHRALHYLLVAAAELVFSGCGDNSKNQPTCPACSPSQDFVYATGGGEVLIFPAAQNGALGNPASLPGPHGPIGIAVSRASRQLFASDHIFDTIYVFNQSTANQYLPAPGSPVSLTSSTGFLEGVAVLPNGRFVYVLGLNGGISAFAVASNGSLTPIPGSPFPVAAGSVAAVTDSSGAFLFTVTASSISVFAIDSASGVLTAIGSPVALPASALATPGMAATTPRQGNFLYVTLTNADAVAAFSFDATGVLKPVIGSPFTVGAAPLGLAATATTVYVMNSLDNTISAMSWDSSTGALSQVNGSPFSSQGGSGPLASINDQFLYVPAPNANAIVGFNIIPGGGLTQLAGSPFPAGTKPNGALTAF